MTRSRTSPLEPRRVGRRRASSAELATELAAHRWGTRRTKVEELALDVADAGQVRVPVFINEFWTSKQRDAHSIHEVSYRACFKPQLPRFFISRLTEPGDVVYDPFMGRGTTVIEAALTGRVPIGNDLNPLSAILVGPRLHPPGLDEIRQRLEDLRWTRGRRLPEDLLVFYHPETLGEILALRSYLHGRARAGELDSVDAWIRMVALNRLTGHSPGFFSVYTLPPNQAVSVAAQRKINRRRGQEPPRRDVRSLILRKSRSLLADLSALDRRTLAAHSSRARLLTAPAHATRAIRARSVRLVVTSPPFLDVVDYAGDNWLRCWFCHIDPKRVALTILKDPADWQAAMTRVFKELKRILVPGGHVAFEVGEVRSGRIRLEELIVPAGLAAGLRPRLILINSQCFTKTSNCWGVANLEKGTNTNRVVLFEKPD